MVRNINGKSHVTTTVQVTTVTTGEVRSLLTHAVNRRVAPVNPGGEA